MKNFSKMMLVEGLEEILVNPEFSSGVNIVSTIQVLIEDGRVEDAGKVKTIISERSSEAVTEEGMVVEVDSPAVEQEAVPSQPSAAPPAKPLSQYPLVIRLAKLMDASMQKDSEATQPALMRLTELLEQGGDLLARLQEQPPEASAGEVSPELSALMQRVDRLPERYIKILMQLLENWEAQVNINPSDQGEGEE